ncbi:MAG TPA: glycosyltransferase [Longimicrobiaceae bacterium]|nr:glycosyltransferase [Longimicrobiaceae bacterium]
MAQRIEITTPVTLDDYERLAQLTAQVRELRAEAQQIVPALEGRTLWMVNSTAQGGGVAEMLPTMVPLLRDLGVRTEWAVIETDEAAFFSLTKRIHNLIHGEGDPRLTPGDHDVIEAVNRRNAAEMRDWFRPGDFLAVHDPQPMPLAALLGPELGLHCIWRCHIGLDEANEQTRAAWDFLRPYAAPYEYAVFSAPEYIPDYFSTRAKVIYPAVNPLTDKNRELSVHKIVGVLANGALVSSPGPVLTPPFEQVAERLLPNGTFAPANMVEDIGLLHRPIITQISRWDRLKGFPELMRAFALLKEQLHDPSHLGPLDRHRLELARLVLAGPDPASVADDPEGREVLEELISVYRGLDPAIQRDIAVVALPMRSARENALMVNAIQRTSSVIAQNSLREGFGLTITEAMWKGVPVLSNRRAVGPRQQIRAGLDGCLIDDPRDIPALARAMGRMLSSPEERVAWGNSAQRRAYEQFLIFAQLGRWLRLLSEAVRGEPG